VIEIIAVLVLLVMTAVVSFGVGSAVGYKAGRKVTQFQTVKRGAEIVAPYARQLFGQFATPVTKSSDDWLTNEYN
jgi:hypothetical protein